MLLMKPQKILSNLSKIHLPLVMLVFFISGCGFLMLYSAAGGNFEPWAKHQIIRFVPGFILMLVLAFTPIRTLLHYSYPAYASILLLLVIVEITGHIGMGAQRWVSFGVINLQPSELMKLATILALARYFHYVRPSEHNGLSFLIIPLLLLMMPVALILKQPNLGTATILTAVGLMIAFIAGVNWRWFVGSILLGLASAPIGWHFLHDYQKQRVLTFLNPEADPLGAGYNILQSMIAIGSGGLFGKGFLNGSQGQLDFLPEKQTDFIFTMLAEEFGFLGGAAIIACYCLLIILALAIASRSRNRFGGLVAAGISAMLFMHVFINIAMVMGMIPVVGVPLPLLSYGGSILLAMLTGFGLLLNA